MKPVYSYKSQFIIYARKVVLLIGLSLTCHLLNAQTKGSNWEPPKSADDIKNPVPADANSIKNGKTNYITYCTPCHGDKGKGDGVAAAGLAIKPADHSSTAIQNKTDGALFWEMSEGHNPMPAYKTAFTEKQRWDIVNYIRTLAKKSK